jgi:MFS family permease
LETSGVASECEICSSAPENLSSIKNGERQKYPLGPELGAGLLTQYFSPGRTRDMSLLMVITCFLFMDQNIMAPNLTDIARDFNFTDTQRDTKLGGEISLSLFLVGAPASLIVGYHADRVNRKNLYSAVVFSGAVSCLLTYFVEEYWQLFVLRALTGIALGGSGPLVYSLIADWYLPEERPRASSYMGLASGLGIGFGQLFAAMMGAQVGWRVLSYLLYLFKRANTEVLLSRRSPSSSFQCLACSSSWFSRTAWRSRYEVLQKMDVRFVFKFIITPTTSCCLREQLFEVRNCKTNCVLIILGH